MGFIVRVALLTVVYLLVLASRDWQDAVVGAALAIPVLAVTHRFRQTDRVSQRQLTIGTMIAFFPFVFAVLVDIVKGSIEVAVCISGIKPIGKPGVVRVPYGERTPLGVVVSSILLTLAPGSVLIDLDDERREMIIHAIDASDPDAVIAGIQQFYERHQRRVFP
jgi:multisubunit Na+/H+ antiporter MnhE subunit